MARLTVLRKYFYFSVGFGVGMGLIFPPFTSLFVSFKSSLHLLAFIFSALAAGITVGFFAYFIGKVTIIKALKEPVEKLQEVLSSKDQNIKSRDEVEALIEQVDTVYRLLTMFIITMKNLDAELISSMSELQSIIDNLSSVMQSQNQDISSLHREIESIKKWFTYIVESNDEQNQVISITAEYLEDIIQGEARYIEKKKEVEEINTEVALLLNSNIQKVNRTAQLSKEIGIGIGVVNNDFGQINARMQEMKNYLSAIMNIAEETKILAVNTNIQAAHLTGKDGRGFQVIGKSISALAENSHKSSELISEALEGVLVNIHALAESLHGEHVKTIENRDLMIESQHNFASIKDNVSSMSHAAEDLIQVMDSHSSKFSEVDGKTKILRSIEEDVKNFIEEETNSLGRLYDIQHLIEKRLEKSVELTEGVISSAQKIQSLVSSFDNGLEKFRSEV
jgi:methyl-accepting chemotaxis protein